MNNWGTNTEQNDLDNHFGHSRAARPSGCCFKFSV